MLLCLPFTDGTLKGHFGMVYLVRPPLSVAVKLLCLQHVREVACKMIQGCEVSISVRCNDDSCLASLDSVRTYFTTATLCFVESIYPHLYDITLLFILHGDRPCCLNPLITNYTYMRQIIACAYISANYAYLRQGRRCALSGHFQLLCKDDSFE